MQFVFFFVCFFVFFLFCLLACLWWFLGPLDLTNLNFYFVSFVCIYNWFIICFFNNTQSLLSLSHTATAPATAPASATVATAVTTADTQSHSQPSSEKPQPFTSKLMFRGTRQWLLITTSHTHRWIDSARETATTHHMWVSQCSKWIRRYDYWPHTHRWIGSAWETTRRLL